MSEELDRLSAEIAGLRKDVAALTARLEDVQGLAARAYEAPLDGRAGSPICAPSRHTRSPDRSELLVSVRMATYDNAEMLCERTLASLLAQTYARWEAVVVGERSHNTAERIAAIGDLHPLHRPAVPGALPR